MNNATRRPAIGSPFTVVDDQREASTSGWLSRSSSIAFLTGAVLLAVTGALLITEERLGVTLFPAALTALALGAIALAAALGGLVARRRRHQLRGGLVAMSFCGIVAASGVVLAVMVPVGIATGGLTGDAPAVVDRVVAVAMLSLAVGLFVALLLSGFGAWRAGIPSRGVGVALMLAALPFLAPALFAATGFWMDELVGFALFVIWTAIFGGIGLVLRRG